jgi:hypothetical protein
MFFHAPSASLSIIGLITDDTFWLTSDTGWREPTKITPSVSEAKVTCIATFPVHYTLQTCVKGLVNLDRLE